jgi:hypothetical protein
MARIASKNTAPEVSVRRVLHRLGFRFRLHRYDLPGRPNVVYRGIKLLFSFMVASGTSMLTRVVLSEGYPEETCVIGAQSSLETVTAIGARSARSAGSGGVCWSFGNVRQLIMINFTRRCQAPWYCSPVIHRGIKCHASPVIRG